MAEAIGLAASIAGLITLAGQIAKLSYGYLSDIKNASKSQKLYLQEVAALTNLLLRVDVAALGSAEDGDASTSNAQQLLLAHRGSDSNLSAMIAECHTHLKSLKSDLEKYLLPTPTNPNSSRSLNLRRFHSNLLWPFEEKEVAKHIAILHRFRSVFADLMGQDVLVLSAATYDKVDILTQEQEHRLLLEWLSFPEAPRSSAAIIDLACPGTGKLFLNSEKYRDWCNGTEAGLLWCFGKPGAGKTTLSAIAQNDIQETHKGALILHHFHDFTKRNQQTTMTVLQMLLAQIVSQATENQRAFLYKFRESSFKPPRLKDLTKAFIDVISLPDAPSSVYLFIDAPDEFDDRKNLFILLRGAVEAGVRVLVTSRDVPDIRDAFKKDPQLEIEACNEDLTQYVEHRLEESEFSRVGSSSIVGTIVERAGGIFLLARLVMDQLLNLTTVKQMRKFLHHMPITVHEGYKSTLERILTQPPSRVALALRAIGWITHVERPLKVNEILHAFALEEDEEEEEIDEENLVSPNMLLQVCIGLVTINRETSTVEMIHATAYDFFRNQPKHFSDIHVDISRTCIGYLSLSPLRTTCDNVEALRARFKQSPFLAYAARHWGDHARKVERTVQPQIHKLLNNSPLRASSFQALQYREWTDAALAHESFQAIPSGQGPLHIAAYWNLVFTAKTMLITGADPSLLDSERWTPLHWACSNNHEAMVNLLLEFKADLNVRDSKGWTPLFWACFKGNVQIVSILFAHNADHLVMGFHGWTALHWAVASKQTEAVKLLLEHHKNYMANVEPVNVPIRTLSVDQARQMRTRTHAHLIKSSKTITPLEIAAEEQDTSLFDTLINDLGNTEWESTKRSFNDIWSQKKFDPPMSNVWRVMNKAERIRGQEYYLSDPISSDEESDWKSRLLHVAIKDEKLLMVQMLVELGADVNRPADGYVSRYPLHTAAFRRNPRFAEILLQHRADPSLKDSYGLTPLHQAIINGFEDTAMVLIKYGADVNTATSACSKSKATNSPLMLACGLILYDSEAQDAHIPEHLVQHLLSNGADVSRVNEKGETALHCAVRLCGIGVIKQLVAAGASVAAVDHSGQTVLHHFARRSNYSTNSPIPLLQEICGFLLQHWNLKQAETVSHYDLCPVLLALKKRHWKNFEVLLSNGVGMWKDSAKSLPCGPAISALEPQAVSFLLEHEAQISPDTALSLVTDAAKSIRMKSPAERTVQITSFKSIYQILLASGLIEKSDIDALIALMNSEDVDADDEALSAALKDSHMMEARNTEGYTPLHIATRRGNAALVKELLARGADIETADVYGWRPLHTAVYKGYDEIVDILLESNAEVCATTVKWAYYWGRPTGISQGNAWRGHPLHLAAMFGRRSMAEKLLERGADVKADTGWARFESYSVTPGKGPTALHIVLDTGLFYGRSGDILDQDRLEIARMLVDRGADVATVADHLELDDVLRFVGYEELWDRLRVGIKDEKFVLAYLSVGNSTRV